MKKLLTFVSAITAGAIGTAAADVSVAGSGTFYYSSASGDTAIAENEDSMAITGGTVTFAMSTETTNGITVTAGATISRDTDDIAEYTDGDALAAGSQGVVGGMSSLTFGMDGMTVTLGDINNAGSGTGEGGDVATFASTHAGVLSGDSASSANDSAMDGIADGTGVNVNTSMGAATIDLTYALTNGSGSNSLLDNATTTGRVSAMALNVGFDMAGASVNVATGGNQANAAGDKNDSATAVEVTYPASDALSLTVGGSAGTIAGADEDNIFVSGAYTMDADTTLSFGYGKGDNTTTAGVVDKATALTLNVSRSLGGGVSVFAEYASVSVDNAAVGTSGTAMTVGTSVSF